MATDSRVASIGPETIRCPQCGGLNAVGADWCGQCLNRFTPPPPPPAAPPAPDAAPGPAELLEEIHDIASGGSGSVDSVFGAVTGTAVPATGDGTFVVTEAGVSWTCTRCDTMNPLAATACSVCGTTFADVVRPSGPTGRSRDPNKTAMVALFFPGAGHAYLEMWGQAITRGVTSLWVICVAVVAAIQRDLPGASLLATSFGLAAVALWIVDAHDAFCEASGQGGRAILQGRRFMYLTMTLLSVLIVGLFTAFLAAGS